MKRRKNKPSIKQNKQVQLTSEQLRQLFFAKCKDRDHLHEWIQLFWGVNLPKSTVSRYSNCNPLDAVWNVYNACIWDMKGLDVLYIAPRAGGKCVLEGTLIPVKDYGLKKIEDVKVGCKIYSGFGWREVLETFDEGVKFGYGIKTVSGKEMVGSINHRVLGYDGVHQTWIHVSDLKVNDIVFGIDDDFNLTEEKVRETFTYTGHFYDLSVKGDHSYVSNGIISHNTLGVAITESMLLFHDRRGAIHIGAIEKQAKRAYSMFQSFLGRNKEILAPLVEKSVIEKTTLIVDNESVTLECLPCTVSACNGPHEAFCCMDELDTLSPEGLNAYKQISGIPVKHRLTGAPPVKVGISTRKSAYGLVQKQMDTAEQQGRLIKMWNQIDLTERCDVKRHGTQEVTVFVDQKRMHHIPKEEFDKLTEDKQKDYIAYPMTDGCLKCALASCCLCDLKHQDPEMTPDKSTMILSIDEVITKIRGADTDWVLAELMCLKPSTEGIVFKEFDKARHVVSWDKMWEKLTKEKPTVLVGEVEFIKELHRRKVPIFGALDWGWSAPSTFVAAAIDQEENVYVLRAFGLTKTNDPTFIHIVKTKYHRYYKVQMYYPDVANGSAVDLMKSAGLPVATKIDKSENLGVQVIKRCLNVPGTSEVKLLVAEETCSMLVHEFERYHYEKDGAGETIDGRFANEQNHCFVPGTLIDTELGLVPIENITPGLKVLTHDGTMREVEGVTVNQYDGDVITIKPNGGYKFTCTALHPILTQKFKRSTAIEGLRKLTGQLRPIGDTEWVLAEDIIVSEKNCKEQVRILSPRIRTKEKPYVYDQLEHFQNWDEKDGMVHPARIIKRSGIKVLTPRGSWSPRFIEVDEDLGFFLGWYIAEGSASVSSGQVGIVCHMREHYTVMPLIERLSKRFSFTWSVCKPSDGNRACFTISSSYFMKICRELGVKDKKHFHNWMLYQPHKVSLAILGGYFFGDGNITEGVMRANSVSKDVIEGVYLLLARFGYRVNQSSVKKDGINKPQRLISSNITDMNLFLAELFKNKDFEEIYQSKDIRLRTCNMPSCKSFITEEYVARTIKSAERTKYSGPVYNLHVKDNHTFCVNGIIVHNCLDPLRYMLVAQLGKAHFVVASDEMSVAKEEPLRAPDGSYYRPPNFYELAQENGISVLPPESKPFNRDNEDDDSSDGFMWGF